VLPYAFSDEAQADLESHYLYLAQRNPGAAQRLVQSIFASIEQACTFPEAAPRVVGISESSAVPGTRKLIEGEYRYIIYYRVTDGVLTILRIYHPSQRR
jgi:plasmid stabilization system protein ParE